MTEKEMEDLLWYHPADLFGEPLKQFRRQLRSQIGITDLVFEDKIGRLIVVEVKKGKLPRGAINQLVDYFGVLKRKFPARSVELMVVANSVPEERRVACERYDIEWLEISEKRFRRVAERAGYRFSSEEEPAKQGASGKAPSNSSTGPRPASGKQETGPRMIEAQERLGAEWTARDLARVLGVAKSNGLRRLKKWLVNGAAEKIAAGKRGRAGNLARYRFKAGP